MTSRLRLSHRLVGIRSSAGLCPVYTSRSYEFGSLCLEVENDEMVFGILQEMGFEVDDQRCGGEMK
ncbi:hypothetical protein TREMEDRAFT_56621 [Tremella mesenterica DSM 1558]|uniref:uncharacterized protein n=1 Tax=Tremella mesenterica (strain ATCC 24925 / CBS 8224 / DSM 1558 / NBRC 9311 / NRRL Y-6157 / RJB 2259-6 / UBC 559-6) TaxID=578456 RepID=UPI0003F49089|nr:uncharacterized protein TREMEDRAFT_56621 [Tremella mesenterica DSM 1558]EIW70574.1 hypothetical protein TREMEDRAFT_56621 [Tremella mesenterica DSM 1558]